MWLFPFTLCMLSLISLRQDSDMLHHKAQVACWPASQPGPAEKLMLLPGPTQNWQLGMIQYAQMLYISLPKFKGSHHALYLFPCGGWYKVLPLVSLYSRDFLLCPKQMNPRTFTTVAGPWTITEFVSHILAYVFFTFCSLGPINNTIINVKDQCDVL